MSQSTFDLHSTRRAAAAAFIAEGLTKNKAWSTKSYAYDYTPQEASMYLGWYDDDNKKTTEDKIGEAIEAYVARFQMRPNIVLVCNADRDVYVKGMKVQDEDYIRRNNFWVGRTD